MEYANALTIVETIEDLFNIYPPAYKFVNPSKEIQKLAERIRLNISEMKFDRIPIYANEYAIPCSEGGGPFYSGEFSEFDRVLRRIYSSSTIMSDDSEMNRKSKLFCDTVRAVYEKNKRSYTFMFNKSQKLNRERGSVF